MKTALDQLPPQHTGRQTDFTHEKKYDTLEAAHSAFQAAAGRLLSVNNWLVYSGAGSANFVLCNNQGEEVAVMAEEGFFISIDLPGPGPDGGGGLEWVLVEKLVSEGGAHSAEQYVVMTVRPVADPRRAAAEIGDSLTKLAERPVLTPPPVPRELAIEAKITENMTSTIDELKQIGDKSDFVCPDCGGGLYAIKNDPAHRYRCHTGHVYTENILQDIQGLHLEESVWVSIRMLEERHNLLTLVADHASEAGQTVLANAKREQVAAMDRHISQLKLLLSKLTQDLLPASGTEG